MIDSVCEVSDSQSEYIITVHGYYFIQHNIYYISHRGCLLDLINIVISC